MTRHGVFATAVALRGISLIDSISPKISPFPILPMTLLFAVRVTSPSRSEYILARRARTAGPVDGFGGWKARLGPGRAVRASLAAAPGSSPQARAGGPPRRVRPR